MAPFRPGRLLVRLGLAALCLGWTASPADAAAPRADRGEFGGDLNFLRRFHAGPRGPQESNHFIDLWSPGSLEAFARLHGLTNNRALFVDSHARSGIPRFRERHAYHASDEAAAGNRRRHYFSARDLAAILGPEAAAGVHNIVLGGCNRESSFRPEELRKYFVNATNIVHMTAGEFSYRPVFFQMLTTPSAELKPFHGKLRPARGELVECEISTRPGPGLQPLGQFVARLYAPGAAQPFSTRLAGRELLEPGFTRPKTLPAGDLAALFRRVP
jgi:hypothetical protein